MANSDSKKIVETSTIEKALADSSLAVKDLIKEATLLRQDIYDNNDKAQQNQKILRRLSIMILVLIIAFIPFTITTLQTGNITRTLNDCLGHGQCSQRNNATTQLIIFSVSFRSEKERLETEMPIALAKGDTVRYDALKQRYIDETTKLKQVDENIADIQAHKAPRNKIDFSATVPLSNP